MSSAAATAVDGETARRARHRADSATAMAWRVRLSAVIVALGALVFRQAPGLVASDTKLDLTLNPGGFLARALSLWDDDSFGQLQNQAYGYLFPVGSFHWALDSLGTPDWVTQRLWWWVVLTTAFLGLWRLSGALGIGGPWPRLLAAVLYALSPRMLGEVAVTSAEVWPAAVAPWILAPLADRGERSWRWRILRSATAAACLGGVNAVASAAAVIPPALWWITRRHTRHTLQAAAAWAGCLLAAVGWWIGPLLLLGRYSPPFLTWIEDARVTTGTASPFTAVQGTTAWLGYLSGADGPSWPGAFRFAVLPLLVVLSMAVATLGLGGLLDRRLPERRFLLVLTVAGLLLLTLGWVGPGSGPWAGVVQGLLDGALAPLRNIHKFELVLRLPIALGVASAATRLARFPALGQLPRPLAGLVAGLLVVAVSGPGVAATITRPGAYEDVPDYWRSAATWLDRQAAPGSVLIVPAAPFAEFSWGTTRDEPFQALLSRPIAVRDLVPLGSAGATRLLDEIGRWLARGQGDAGLTRLMGEAGIGYVLVRNDLSYAAQGAQPLALHDALGSAGLTRVATFGPPAGSPIETPDQTLNEHTLLPYPALEVYAVPDVTVARLAPVGAVAAGWTGAEDAAALADAGLATTVVAPSALPDAPLVVSDGNRRRELAFGIGNGASSEVLAAGDPGRAGRRTMDVIDPQAPQTTLVWGGGVQGVRASSSASDTTATLRIGEGTSPLAALDGDPSTSWVSGTYGAAVGEWLEVTFDQPRSLVGTLLTPGARLPGSAPAAVVSVITDNGTSRTTLGPPGRSTELAVPEGLTSRLRVRLDASGPGNALAFDIAELRLPGIAPRPWLALPDPGGRALDAVTVHVQRPGSSGCHYAGDRPLCSSSLVLDPEEAGGLYRVVTTAKEQRFTWTGTVSVRPGTSLEALLDLPGRIGVNASSRSLNAPAARPATVVDGDLGTGWVAGTKDLEPTLTLELPQARTVTGVQLLVDQYLAGARARTVRVEAPGLDQTLKVDSEGFVHFPATTTTRLTLRLSDPEPITTIDPLSGVGTRLPVGVSELVLVGGDDLRTPLDQSASVSVSCGFGPDLVIDGQRRLTEVIGTVADVLRERPLTWRECASPATGASAGPVALSAGRHTVEAPASAQFRPSSLVLRSDTWAAPTGTTTPTRRADGSWELPARSTDSLLVLPHNANVGFAAHDISGMPLRPVVVAGWQQGWWVPAGEATVVTETFGPQGLYSWLLGLGGVAVMALVVTACWPVRARGTSPTAAPATGAPSACGWALIGVGAALAAGGSTAATALGYAALVLVVTRGRPTWVIAALTAGPAAIATALVAASPWMHGGAQLTSWGAQWGVLAAVALVVASGAGEDVLSSLRRPHRMIGRSTKR